MEQVKDTWNTEMNEQLREASSLMLTEAAATRVQHLIGQEGNSKLMLRLEVSGGGCSGFSYRFELDEKTNGDDQIFEFFGVKLVVDGMSLDLLHGSEVDYVEDLLASSFRVKNPQATSTCGCGTSFSM